MFDFRYHALSLVAVFLALTIGLLLGVAIGDEGLVSSAERDIRDSLKGDLQDAREENVRLRGELDGQRQLQRDFYPLMVGGRLPARRIGILALGDVSDSVVDDVRDALAPTGGRLATVTVVRIPPDIEALSGELRGTRFGTMANNPDLVTRFGRRVGIDFVRDGRVLRSVRRTVLESSSGSREQIDGVVLVRRGGELGGEAGAATAAFEDGIVDGLQRADVPVVGIEESSQNPSGIQWFEEQGLTSVDNIDQVTGRTSLVFGLAGASGTYGTKPTADRLLPEAPDLTVTPNG